MKIIPWRRQRGGTALRGLLIVVTVVAIVLAVAGAATRLVERRLLALAPGGVEIAALFYNPFTGALRLHDVRARDADGRVIFSSPEISGRADVGAVLTGPLALRRLDVRAPRVVVHQQRGGVIDLAQGRGWLALGSPLTVEGVMITDGTLLVSDASAGSAHTVARGIDLRLDRLEAASPGGWTDAAFLVRMTAYGTTVYLTGRPLASGDYGLAIRARDVDLAGWLHDVPVAGVTAARGARADVDLTVTIAKGRATMSGTAGGGPVTITAGEGSEVRARAARAVLEHLDLVTGQGRIATLHLQAPRVTLRSRERGHPLDEARALIARLDEGGLRRLTVVDGDVTLVNASGRRLVRVLDVTAGMDARGPRDLVVRLAGRVGHRGRVSLRGVVRPGEGSFDGDVYLADLALSALGAPLVSASRRSEGALSFSGHVNLADVGGAPSALVSGRASLASPRMTWTTPVPRDFTADALTVALRRYEWPRGVAVFDSVTLTRPAWSTVTTIPPGVTMNDDAVVVTQSVVEPTPLDGLLAAVETASRASLLAPPADTPSLFTR